MTPARPTRGTWPSAGLFALLIAVAFAAPALADGEVRHIDYVAGDGAIIWCPHEVERGYVPVGAPPVDPNDPFAVVDWSVSGSPECAGPDAWSSEGHDGGFGGGAFCYADMRDLDGNVVMDCGGNHAGHVFTISVDDAIGNPYVEVRFPCPECSLDQPSAPTVAGCGSLAGQVPNVVSDPWNRPMASLVWVKVKALHVDSADLDTCIGSKGTLTVTY